MFFLLDNVRMQIMLLHHIIPVWVQYHLFYKNRLYIYIQMNDTHVNGKFPICSAFYQTLDGAFLHLEMLNLAAGLPNTLLNEG